VIEAWRREYNEERTHRTIGDVTPMEFIHNHHNRPQAAQESTSLAVVYQAGEGQPPRRRLGQHGVDESA